MPRDKRVVLIAIDPFSKTIGHVETDGSLSALQAVVQGPMELMARLDPGHDLWGDEEGCFHPPYAFWYVGDVRRRGARRSSLGRGFVARAT